MTRKGRRLLKLVGLAYLVALGFFIASLRYGAYKRERPELRPAKIAIRQEESFSGPDAELRFEDMKEGIVEAGYLVRGPEAGLEAGTRIGPEELDRLIAANPGDVIVWDLQFVRAFAAEDLKSGEEVRDAEGSVIVKRGDPLDKKALVRMALEFDHQAVKDRHRTLWVLGRGSIIGLDMTLVFTGLNFVALVALLYALLWDPVTRILDDRAKAVREDVESARRDREEAEATKASAAAELTKIRDDACRLRDEGRQEGEREKARLVREGHDEARRHVERTERLLDTEAEAAREALAAELGGLSCELASRVLEREVAPEDHAKLTEDLLRSLEAEAEGKGAKA
jgi:F-type H+-transporting ATPase subunit b